MLLQISTSCCWCMFVLGVCDFAQAMRKFGHELSGCCDLLVCDEGHRLKSKGGNKTIDALLALNCPRRVVLTGTPVQNNLGEVGDRQASQPASQIGHCMHSSCCG